MEIEVGKGAAARRIAVEQLKGREPTVMWLGGYRSDMAGTKAVAIAQWCAENGLSCLRQDYSGHGRSGGRFEDGTLSRWLEESLAVHDRFVSEPAILVGSSMGGWIALLMAREIHRRGGRLKGMALIAPAPDFTEALMWPRLSPAQQHTIMEHGRLEEPSAYSQEPNVYTRQLFEDGRNNLVMTREVRTHCPVVIVQGGNDPDVPASHAQALASLMPREQVTFTLIPDGDHRLSRNEDIALILRHIGQLAGV